MNRWKCWIGLHDWSPWGRLRLHAPTTWSKEGRWCHRCNAVERRWTPLP